MHSRSLTHAGLFLQAIGIRIGAESAGTSLVHGPRTADTLIAGGRALASAVVGVGRLFALPLAGRPIAEIWGMTGLLLCLLASPSAGSAAPNTIGSSEEVRPRFELLHLWLTEEEDRAVAVFRDALMAKGVEWSEHRHSSSFLSLKTEYADRLALGNPPTGTHWIASEELRQMVDSGVFRLIESAPGNPPFEELLLPEILEVVSHGSGITTLPVGIHLQNHMVYNAEIFDELQLDVPDSWEELIQIMPQIKAAGYTPITMSDERWQLRFFFFSILSSLIGPDDLIALVNGTSRAVNWRAELIEALGLLDAMRDYTNADNANLGWEASIDQLVEGRAVISFLADFSSPLYADDERFVCRLPPGNDYVIWAFDSIALTRTDDPAEIAGQDAMIEIAGKFATLQRYVGEKGGIPVQVHSSMDGINRCSVQSIAEWQRASRKIHIGPGWTTSLNVISAVVQNFWRSPGTSAEATADEIIEVMGRLRDLTVGMDPQN